MDSKIGFITVHNPTGTKKFYSYDLVEFTELSEDVGSTYCEPYSITADEIYLTRPYINSLIKRAQFYMYKMGLYWYALKDLLEAANMKMQIDHDHFSPVKLLEKAEVNNKAKVLFNNESFYNLTHTEQLYKELNEIREFNYNLIKLIPEALYCQLNREVEEKLQEVVKALEKWVENHEKVSNYLISIMIGNYKEFQDEEICESPKYHNLLEWYKSNPDSLYEEFFPSIRKACMHFLESLKQLESLLIAIKDINSTSSTYII